MEQKRCFSPEVVRCDDFIEMPPTAQLLYFQLGISSDDRGVCSSIKSVMKILGSTTDDLKILIAKGFLRPIGDTFLSIDKTIDTMFNVNNNLGNYKNFKESVYFELIKDLKIQPNLQYGEVGIDIIYGKAPNQNYIKSIGQKETIEKPLGKTYEREREKEEKRSENENELNVKENVVSNTKESNDNDNDINPRTGKPYPQF